MISLIAKASKLAQLLASRHEPRFQPTSDGQNRTPPTNLDLSSPYPYFDQFPPTPDMATTAVT